MVESDRITTRGPWVRVQPYDSANLTVWSTLWKDYTEGFPLKSFLRHVRLYLDRATELDQRSRDQLLGQWTRFALDVAPKRRGRGPKGLPPSIRDTVRIVMDITKGTCPHFSSQQRRNAVIESIRLSYGVKLTVDQLDKYLYARKPRPRRRRG